MKQSIRILMVFLSTIFASHAYAQSTIYQWKDSQGRVNYTQIKPEYTIQQSTQVDKDEKAPLIPAQAQSQTKSQYNVKVFESSKAMLVNIKPRNYIPPSQEAAAITEPAKTVEPKIEATAITEPAKTVEPEIEATATTTKVTTPEPEKSEIKLALSDTDQGNYCTTAKHNLSMIEGYMEGRVNLLKLKKLKNSDGTETTITKDQIEAAKEKTLKEVDAYCTKQKPA